MGALAANGQTLAMPDALVATDLDLALDVLRHVSTKVTFDREVAVDPLTDLVDFLFGEVTNASVAIELKLVANLLRRGTAYAEDVSEADLQPLLAGDVDAGNTCHIWFSSLALALLVLGGFANHHDAAVPTDDLALIANRFDARLDLHDWSFIGIGNRRLSLGQSLVPVGDAAPREVVGRQLDLDTIARKDPDVVHAHFPRDVGQNVMAVLELHAEHGIGKGFVDGAFQHNRVFFRLRQGYDPLNGTSRLLTDSRKYGSNPETRTCVQGPV
jgi:hypothetical protein